MPDVSNAHDIIDSRDVIARLEELDDEIEDARDRGAGAGTDLDDLEAERDVLEAFASEGESCPDWIHGETLIRDSYFREYAEQLADDLGLIQDEAVWPYRHIDWDEAADELRQDYTELDFDGVSYWARV